MGTTTNIEWCDATWNCVRGCSRVSEGCRNCYAERMAARFSGFSEYDENGKPVTARPFQGFVENGRWTGRVELIEEKLNEPLHWRKPRRVFVNSMSDLFHERLGLRDIAKVYAVIGLSLAQRLGHEYQILTKRPARRQELFDREEFWDQVEQEMDDICGRKGWCSPGIPDVPFANAWEGVSVEDQKTADERIPLLLQTPAALRFLSLEPLLGPVDLARIEYNPGGSGGGCFINALTGKSVSLCGSQMLPKIDWVIVGGESGPGAREFNPDWAGRILGQCRDANVPFFMKQMGSNPTMRGYSLKLRDRKGGDPAEWPPYLQVREYPR